jgi:hypothetical protein
MSSAVRGAVTLLFYVSWFAIRCLLYPYLCLWTFRAWAAHVDLLKSNPALQGSRYPVLAGHSMSYMVGGLQLVVVTMLNLKWTADLVKQLCGYKQPGKGL